MSKYSREAPSVAYLKIFMKENSTVTKSTTLEVCEQIVKVEVSTGTYIEFLMKEPSTKKHVQKATVFVSHVWSGKFCDLVEALSAWCTDNNVKEENTFAWIDLFCMEQSDEPTHTQLVDNYKSHFEKISKAVIVLEPWPQDIQAIRDYVPTWTKSLWCLFEFAMLRESPTR